MEAALRSRTAVAVCGLALCGALAAPVAMEVAASLTQHDAQVQVDAVRKKPKKPPRHGVETTGSTIVAAG
ncbi:hypothetical protein [Streptomyces sp. NPDC003395]